MLQCHQRIISTQYDAFSTVVIFQLIPMGWRFMGMHESLSIFDEAAFSTASCKGEDKVSCEDNNAVALFSELLSDGNRVYLFHDIDSFRLNLLEI